MLPVPSVAEKISATNSGELVAADAGSMGVEAGCVATVIGEVEAKRIVAPFRIEGLILENWDPRGVLQRNELFF